MMHFFILIFPLLIGLLGCKSSPPEKLVAIDYSHEQEIYTVLMKEPVPLPQITPYDLDARQRQFFVNGFRAGWERAISGALLHGTFGTPVGLADDVREAWTAGWNSGVKTGSDTWLAESQKLRERVGQHGAANGSHPVR